MTFYTFGFMVGIIITLLNGAWVMTSAPRKAENRLWALLSVCVIIWFFGRLMILLSTSQEQAFAWQRFMYAGAIFLNIVYFHFIEEFSNKAQSKQFLFLGYAIAFGLFVANLFSHLFVSTMQESGPFHYYEKAGPIYVVHLLLYLVYPGAGFIMLLRENIAAQGFRRNQIQYLIVASVIGFACGVTTFPMVFGSSLLPIGAPFVWVYVVIVSYAIVKHRLMDITVIIRKTLIYSVVTIMLTTVYLGIISLLTRIFAGLTGHQTVLTSTIAAVAITLCFQPLRKKVQGFVDAKFFRKYVDREEKLYELSREVITHTTPEAMAESLVRVLNDTLHPKAVALYLRSRDGAGFTLVSKQEGLVIPRVMPESNALADYFLDHPQPFVQQDSPSGEPLDTRQPNRKPDAAA